MTSYRYDSDCDRVLPVSGGASERLVEDVLPHVSCEGTRCGSVALEEDAESEGWVRCDNCESWYCPPCGATETTSVMDGPAADYPLCNGCDADRREP